MNDLILAEYSMSWGYFARRHTIVNCYEIATAFQCRLVQAFEILKNFVQSFVLKFSDVQTVIVI